MHTVCTWCAHDVGIRLAIRTFLLGLQHSSPAQRAREQPPSTERSRLESSRGSSALVPMTRGPTEQMPARAGERQHIGRSCGASGLAVIPQIRSGDCCKAVGGARRAAIGWLLHPSSRCEQKPAARGVHGVHAVSHGQRTRCHTRSVVTFCHGMTRRRQPTRRCMRRWRCGAESLGRIRQPGWCRFRAQIRRADWIRSGGYAYACGRPDDLCLCERRPDDLCLCERTLGPPMPMP